MSDTFGGNTFATGLFSGGEPGWVYRPQSTPPARREVATEGVTRPGSRPPVNRPHR